MVAHATTHEWKVASHDFDDVHTGRKNFEVALMLDNMKVGDYVVYKELSNDATHPARSTRKIITYIQHLTGNLCVIALNELEDFYI